MSELDGAITFDDVTFRYPGTTNAVVRGLTFSVEAGDRVAIVGHTGAGKSSIAKLIGRIYDPDQGAVLIDGVDLRDYDLGSLRKRIGVVPQEAFLFRGTVASNIGYARPDASREDIEEAARRAGVLDTLLAIEGGFDAKVEEEGRNLTAAERQLVAIARAVLAGPDILVLDEATSSLDARTEAQVVDALFALGITTILVTHRLPLAEQADLVVMLDEGQIVEAGSHKELVAAGGEYPKLWAYSLSKRPAGTRRRREPQATAKRAPKPKQKTPAKKVTVAAKKTARKAASTTAKRATTNGARAANGTTRKAADGTAKKKPVGARKA